MLNWFVKNATTTKFSKTNRNSSEFSLKTGVDYQSLTWSSKHKLRHEKPFKCDVPSCNRTEGFTTKNDLDRHKKSIHAVQSGKSFMCAAPHCAKKNKIWPRADNFRQHIHRLHAGCNVQELMDQSVELFKSRNLMESN